MMYMQSLRLRVCQSEIMENVTLRGSPLTAIYDITNGMKPILIQ